jgi:hypothetical protein
MIDELNAAWRDYHRTACKSATDDTNLTYKKSRLEVALALHQLELQERQEKVQASYNNRILWLSVVMTILAGAQVFLAFVK